MTKELLMKLRNAKTDEERKQIIECSKEVLTNEDLEQISGGKPITTLKITKDRR